MGVRTEGVEAMGVDDDGGRRIARAGWKDVAVGAEGGGREMT